MITFPIHVLLVLGAFLAPVQDAKPRTELPIQTPTGWESRDQDSTLLLTPKDLAAGQVYAVLVPGLMQKVGTVRKLLEVAKATLGQVGEFKPANERAGAKTDPGWEFEVVIGTLKKGGKDLMAQAMGLRKGDKEGIILILSDSVATLQKYAETFNAMVRLMDAPLPASAPPAAGAGAVDLVYTAPDGWTAKPQGGTVLLSWSNESSKGPSDSLRKYQLIILPSQPIQAGLRKTFLDFWDAQLKPAFETSIMPLPMLRRLKSGALCAFDIDDGAKAKNGQETPGGLFSVGLYVVAQGRRAVPIVGIFLNRIREIDAPLLALMDSARIPKAGDDKIIPFTQAEIAGDWVESSLSMANYVTASGKVVGDASLFTGSGVTLNPDQTFKYHFVAVGRGTTITADDQGKWSVDDTHLILEGKARTRRYVVYGFGKDPKVASFLALSMSFDADAPLDLGFPRGSFQSTIFKKKE